MTLRGLIRRATGRDDGSMLLALLGIVVVTGIMLALLTTVLIGQKSTQHDARYNASVQGADAGIQQAYYQINSLDDDSTVTSLSSGGVVTLNDVDYTWTATRSAAEWLDWTATSTGTASSGADDTARTVTASIRQISLFNMAAFADATINFGGNNTATSYPTAGQGQIGTNGTISLLGNSTEVDGITFYDWDANPDPDRCDGLNCDADTTEDGDRLDIGAALGADGFIQTQLDLCKTEAPLTAFVGSTIAARAEPYCFTSFFADTDNFTVTGTGVAKIYVEGGDVVLGNKNHSDINYDVVGAPNSIKLQIYTTGETVSMYNQGQ